MRWWQQHTSASPSSAGELWHGDGDVQHDRDGHEWLDREQNRIHPNREIAPGNKSASPKHCAEWLRGRLLGHDDLDDLLKNAEKESEVRQSRTACLYRWQSRE